MKDERQVIRWKNDAGGRSAFLKKCESLIRLRILSLLRSCIEKSHLYIDQKILFEETLKDSHSIEHYFKREDYHPNPNFNFDMEDNMEFQCQVSKKLKTRTKSYILEVKQKLTELMRKKFSIWSERLEIFLKMRRKNQQYHKVFQSDFNNWKQQIKSMKRQCLYFKNILLVLAIT